MDAQGALADLVDVSTPIEAAVVFEAGGDVVGSTSADGQRAAAIAGAGQRLLDEASALRVGRRAVEAAATAREGALAAVRAGDVVVAAVVERDPPLRLVLHDLRACLRALTADAGALTGRVPDAEEQ